MWTLKQDNGCLQDSRIDQAILKIRDNMLEISLDQMVNEENAYICNSNSDKFVHLQITVYEKCEKSTFSKPNGDKFVINVAQFSVAETYSIDELLKASSSPI